jgi:hypothetical protein
MVEGLLYACLAACAAAGRARLCGWVFAGLPLTVGISLSVAGGGCIALGQPREAVLPLILSAAYAAVLGLVLQSQCWLRHGLAAHGAAALLLRASCDCLVCGDCGRGGAGVDAAAIAWFLCGGAMVALSRQLVSRAVSAVTTRLEGDCRAAVARHLNQREPALGDGAGSGQKYDGGSARMGAGGRRHGGRRRAGYRRDSKSRTGGDCRARGMRPARCAGSTASTPKPSSWPPAYTAVPPPGPPPPEQRCTRRLPGRESAGCGGLRSGCDRGW